MATNDTHYDPLRNPQVDYERSDLSARGILWFLIGLFIAGFFIELVLWGMFHFMARTEALFPQPQVNPMLASGRNIRLAHRLWESGEIYQYIPEDTYEALAEILRWVNSLNTDAQYEYTGEK